MIMCSLYLMLLALHTRTSWSEPVCSLPHTYPSTLQVAASPQGPVIQDNGADVILTCDMDGTFNYSDIQFTWELNGASLPGSGQMRRVEIAADSEGLYRCIASLSHSSYPLANVSNGVLVESPRKYDRICVCYHSILLLIEFLQESIIEKGNVCGK